MASAVTNLINTAQNTRTYSNRYRIGVYPFIVDAMEAAKLSSDFTKARTVTNALADADLDQGLSNLQTTAMGSGGTHFDNVMLDILNFANNNHYTFGDGSSTQAPKPFLFIVTDGANNNQAYYGGTYWTGSQPGRPTNFGYCQKAQAMKVTIAILYIPYVKIQNPNPKFAGDEDGKVNAIIDQIPGDLAACASPGFFFTANSDADINNVMQTMFAQSLKAARLTQ